MGRINLLIVSFLIFSAFTSSEIEFQNKRILKEIPKIFNVNDFVLNEIQIPESLSDLHSTTGKFYTITNTDSHIGYSYVGRVNSCRTGGCSIAKELQEDRNYEYFDYFIIYNTELKIMSVRVFNYQATHGYEITAKSWLEQFSGYNGSEELIVGKNVDSISGATISVYAITFDIQTKSEILMKAQN